MPEFTTKRQLLGFLLFSLSFLLISIPTYAQSDTKLNLGVKKSYFEKILKKTTTLTELKTTVGDDGFPLYLYADDFGNQFLLKEGSDGYLTMGIMAVRIENFDKNSVIVSVAFVSGCSNKWTVEQTTKWLPEVISGSDTDSYKDENGLFVAASLGRNFTDSADALLIAVAPSTAELEKAQKKKDAKEAAALLAKLKADVAKAEKERKAEEKANAAKAAKEEKEEKARLAKEKAEAEKAEKKRLEEEKKLAEQTQKEERLGKTLGLTVKELYSAVSSLGFKSTGTTKDATTKTKRYSYSKGASLLIMEESADVLAKDIYAVIDDSAVASEFLSSVLVKLTSTWNSEDVGQLLSAVQTNAKNQNDFSYQVKNLSIVVSYKGLNTTIKIAPLYPALTQSVEQTLWPSIATTPTSAPAITPPKVVETATPASLPTSEPTTQLAVVVQEPSSLPTSTTTHPVPDSPKSSPALTEEVVSSVPALVPDKQEPEEDDRIFKHPWLVFGTGTAVVLGSAAALFLLIPVSPPETGLGNFTIP